MLLIDHRLRIAGRAFILFGVILFLTTGCGLLTTIPVLEPPEYLADFTDTNSLLYYFRHTPQTVAGFQGYSIYYKWYLSGGTAFVQDIQELEDTLISERALNQKGYFRFREEGRDSAPTVRIDTQSDFSTLVPTSGDKEGRIILSVYEPNRDSVPPQREYILVRDLEDSQSDFAQILDDPIRVNSDGLLPDNQDYSTQVRNAIQNAWQQRGGDSATATIDLRLGLVIVAYGLTPELQSVYSPVLSPHTSETDLYQVNGIEITSETP